MTILESDYSFDVGHIRQYRLNMSHPSLKSLFVLIF